LNGVSVIKIWVTFTPRRFAAIVIADYRLNAPMILPSDKQIIIYTDDLLRLAARAIACLDYACGGSPSLESLPFLLRDSEYVWIHNCLAVLVVLVVLAC
jgi:hypothetical protein